jgi:hypothetical protein
MSIRVGRKIYYQKNLQESRDDKRQICFCGIRVLNALAIMLIYNIEKHSLGGDESGHCSCNA